MTFYHSDPRIQRIVRRIPSVDGNPVSERIKQLKRLLIHYKLDDPTITLIEREVESYAKRHDLARARFRAMFRG